MKATLSRFIILFSLLCIIPLVNYAQSENQDSVKSKDWRIETEPASYFIGGYSLSVSRNITKDDRLNVGLYVISLDLPTKFKSQMFNNVPDEADVRLGFELAVMVRYKIEIAKKWESNPYIGFIGGWEYFDISQDSLADIRVSTFVATPYIGGELYIFKQMIYINPQLRAVFYLGQKSNLPNRPEQMQSTFFFPQISLGVRL